MIGKKRSVIAVFTAVVLFTSCSGTENGASATTENSAQIPSTEKPAVEKPLELEPEAKIVLAIDREQVERGGRVFSENCEKCHKADAAGDLKWQEKGPDGKYPAPPLNGEGHAWHHPHSVLQEYIKLGSIERGGSMKGFKDVLGEEEINDVIAWFVAKWPEKQYTAWYWRNKNSLE